MTIDNENIEKNNNIHFEEFSISDDKIKNFITFITLLDKKLQEQEI
jgi:hypothetical protein